jgi:hypothetical protein
MATNEDLKGAPVRGGVDFRTLFFGSCAVISLLGGSLYNGWDKSSDEAKRVDAEQWRQIRELGDRIISSAARIETIEERKNDHEERLRSLERESNFTRGRR